MSLYNSQGRVGVFIHSKKIGMKKLSYGHSCSHVHKHTNPHTHTNTHRHTSTVFCLWNWKCDVTWTMTGVFVKDVAVTSNQWTGASSQRDFPLLRVWLVTLRFTAGCRTVSCQSGIQGALLRCQWIKKKKKIESLKFFAFISSANCV